MKSSLVPCPMFSFSPLAILQVTGVGLGTRLYEELNAVTISMFLLCNGYATDCSNQSTSLGRYLLSVLLSTFSPMMYGTGASRNPR